MSSPRGWRAAGRRSKAAEALAAEVRKEGYDCRCPDGHSFLITRPGEKQVIARFNGHPKNETVLKHARRDLRRAGILPGVGGARKNNGKEAKVAMTGETEKTASAELLPRLRAALNELGGDTPQNRTALSERAANIIAFRQENGNSDVEQFGSTGGGRTPPADIARESLRGLLDKGHTGTERSIKRWSVVLDEIERSNGKTPVTLEAPKERGDLDVEGTRMPHADLRKRAEDAEERAELAEQVVGDVERERDDARKALAAERDRVVDLQRDVKSARDKATKAEKRARKAEALKAAPNAQVKELQGKLRGMSGQAGRARKEAERRKSEVAELWERLSDMEANVGAEVDKATAQLRLTHEREMETQRIHVDQLQAALAVAEAGDPDSEIRSQYAAALLAELADSNGSPRDWVLARLDALAGIAGEDNE